MTDIKIRQGSDSGIYWTVYNDYGDPLDISHGYMVRSQVRSLMGGKLLHSWSIADDNIIISQNKVYILWSHADTSSWKWNIGRYDIELVTPENGVARIDHGIISVVKESTR